MRRQLFEKQAYEASKLESQLRSQEIDDINSVLDKAADKKSAAIDEAKKVDLSVVDVRGQLQQQWKLLWMWEGNSNNEIFYIEGTSHINEKSCGWLFLKQGITG